MILKILVICCLPFFLISCERKLVRRNYQEKVIEPQSGQMSDSLMDPHAHLQMDASEGMQEMLQDSIAKIFLEWKTPQNWNEQKGSGMRLVTFTSEEKDPIQCTIVSLGGMAGGLKANVVRWMRQINLSDVSDVQLDEFLKSSEKISTSGEFTAKIVDLRKLLDGQKAKDPSLVVAVIDTDDKIIFVKMTGTFSAVEKNYTKFTQLCRSLRMSHE